MLSEGSLRAVNLLDNNKIIIKQVTPDALFFDVDGTEVIWDLRKDLFSCLCIHESWRGNKDKELCYHLKAVVFWLNKHKDFSDYIRNRGE